MDMWLLLGVFVILDLSLLTFVIVSRSRKPLSAAEKERYSRVWEKILKSDPRHAIMEADKLLYELMEKKGYRGSLGDKLKKAGPSFTDIDGVWKAHKLRNRLAHELGMELNEGQYRMALGQFKKAYRDLGLRL
jgi:hypothetical protein